jgi:hypothetical protein
VNVPEQNPHLRISEVGSTWRVEHVPSGERIAAFKTHDAALKFAEELAPLDWSFSDPLQTPMKTWAGLVAAFDRRGITITPDWTLRERKTG